MLANEYMIVLPAWVWWVAAVVIATFVLGALFAIWLSRPRHERKSER